MRTFVGVREPAPDDVEHGPGDRRRVPNAATIEVGKKALAFTLPDAEGNKLALEDFKGKWVVIYFYPKDDTPGCTKEACEFTDGIEQFDQFGAVVLGCSSASPERHRKFRDKYQLGVTLLSNAPCPCGSGKKYKRC